MKPKLIEKLENIYEEWAGLILQQGATIQWELDFGCYPKDNIIGIGIAITEDHVADLPAFLESNFQCNFNFEEIQIYTICFLHECGHLATDHNFTKAQKKVKDNITFEEYRVLPHEFAADSWAVDYLNSFESEWKYYQAKLEKAYAKVSNKDLEYFAEM